MPNYKRKRVALAYRPAKKRATKPYKEGRITKLSSSRRIYGFPDTLRTTVRYCDVKLLTSTASGVAQHAWRMNSLFDPDFTGIGHQPYFYDQFAGVYSTYAVVKSKLIVKYSLIANTISTAQPSGPCIIGLKTDDDGVASGTLTTAMEAGSSKTDILNNALGGNNVKTLSVDYIPMRDLDTDHNDDSLTTAVTTNPARPWFGTMFVCEQGLASPTTVVCKVEMIFDVIFSQQVTVVGS